MIDSRAPKDKDKEAAGVENENRMKDPTAHIIPLCIDYIIEFDFCEEKSLAECLQLEEKNVRLALKRLEKHGILSSE